MKILYLMEEQIGTLSNVLEDMIYTATENAKEHPDSEWYQQYAWEVKQLADSFQEQRKRGLPDAD